MTTQQAAWEQLPLGVQQCILVLTGGPWVRRVSKAWRDGFDAANDTLRFRSFPDYDQSLRVAATAAATRVLENSASLTAVSIWDKLYPTSPPLMLSDLLAAGAASGLATRLRKLTGLKVTAPWADQQLQALRQCTSLTHLDISGSDQEDCLASGLAAALQAMPRLTRLHMCSGDLLLYPDVMAALASALQPLTQLQHLHLARYCLGEAVQAALAPALSAMPGLQTLDIGNNRLLDAAGAKALCTLLSAVPGLTNLDVSLNHLEDEGTALLAPVLRDMTRLQTLNMCGSLIGDSGMALLAPALAALPHLHTLNLSANDLRASAWSMLQPVLARESSPLHKLDLSMNCMQLSGARDLASGLNTAAQLQELNLSSLADEGWVALAPALRRLGPSLRSLQLGPESLDAAGSAALASALKTLSGLTRLKARHCFTSAALVTISPALVGMRRLQVLDLSGSCMSGEGIAAFAAVLPALAGSLEQLTLENCNFGVEAAANVLAPALAQATCLVALRLSDNDLGPQGAQWLVPVLSALPCLRRADLHSCRLGVPGCMAVARALKDRDGAIVGLRGSGVTKNHVESVELCEMPGINVCV